MGQMSENGAVDYPRGRICRHVETETDAPLK